MYVCTRAFRDVSNDMHMHTSRLACPGSRSGPGARATSSPPTLSSASPDCSMPCAVAPGHTVCTDRLWGKNSVADHWSVVACVRFAQRHSPCRRIVCRISSSRLRCPQANTCCRGLRLRPWIRFQRAVRVSPHPPSSIDLESTSLPGR